MDSRKNFKSPPLRSFPSLGVILAGFTYTLILFYFQSGLIDRFEGGIERKISFTQGKGFRKFSIRVEPDVNVENATKTKAPIHFLSSKHFEDLDDTFSASWLQRLEDFMQMDCASMHVVEDSSWLAYRTPEDTRLEKLRMTIDWLDFSVEHLSHWHKMFHIFDEPLLVDGTISKLDSYMSFYRNHALEEVDPSLRQTIAIIAFQPYLQGEEYTERANRLIQAYLGASLEALRRAGFGRAVVVGMEAFHNNIVAGAIHHLQTQLVPEGKITTTEKVGHMEVSFALGDGEKSKSKYVAENVPRASIAGLQEAFRLARKGGEARSSDEESYIRTWLGTETDPSFWKYVYLTEPDTILQVRQSSIPQLKGEIDKGNVLTPHRFQPIPHESDTNGCCRRQEYKFLRADHHKSILDLDPNGNDDVCCDAWNVMMTHPGIPPHFEDCRNFWYMCDFTQENYQRNGAHERLEQYPLVRFKGGTGIVNLGGSEHGRRCIPQKGSCPSKE